MDFLNYLTPYVELSRLALNFCTSKTLLKSWVQGPNVRCSGAKPFMKSTPGQILLLVWTTSVHQVQNKQYFFTKLNLSYFKDSPCSNLKPCLKLLTSHASFFEWLRYFILMHKVYVVFCVRNFVCLGVKHKRLSVFPKNPFPTNYVFVLRTKYWLLSAKL